MKPLPPRARRVVIKSRIVKLARGGVQAMRAHLSYLQREGVTPEAERGQAYAKDVEVADTGAFVERCETDRHQFRFIVAPEDSIELADLKSFTRQLMAQMERDLETPLDWIAVNHWDTGHPHVHIVLRGKDAGGQDLVINREYMANGMRTRAVEVATDWLGLRTDREIARSVQREVSAERWTSLDATLQQHAREHVVALKSLGSLDAQTRATLLGRLGTLERLGLASREMRTEWRLAAEIEPTLRSLGERNDHIKALHRALKGEQRALSLPGSDSQSWIEGKVIDRGLADEFHDRGYLIIDGTDGRAHYVGLSPQTDVQQFPQGSLVQARFTAEVRSADRRIAEFASDGVYRTEVHRLSLAGTRSPNEITSILEAHTRRLEALRRAGIVDRVSEGVWRIPRDLSDRARAYDQAQIQHPIVTLRSALTAKEQERALGATWLDEQLVRGAAMSSVGFGAEARVSLNQREDFLIESGLAQRKAQRVILARDLLNQLRAREMDTVAKQLSAESGLTYRPLEDGQSVSGTYRRSLMLTSGRFAMLDDGIGFSLVPWRPVIEKRLGQQITAVARGERISWYFGRERGLDR